MTTKNAQPQLLETRRKDVLWIDPRLIMIIPGFNDRTDYAGHEELVESIKSNGIQTPLRGYSENGKYYLIAGHRRLKAVLEIFANGDECRVPFISGKKKTMEEMLIESYVSNDGKRFNPLEESSLVSKLMNYGLTPKEIAVKLGKTPPHISNLVKIASLPTKLKDRIAKDEIKATLVLEIMRSTSNLSVDELAEEIEKMITDKASKGEGSKLTKKDVDKAKGSTNSYAAVKKALKLADRRVIREENRPMFDLLTKLNSGEYSFEQIMEELYEPVDTKQEA